MTTATMDPDVLIAGPSIDERQQHLAEGAEKLHRTRPSLAANPRVTLGVSATLMTVGVTAILLGWFGAARSTLIEEQVPYLISGGLLGVALANIGAVLFFSHWLTASLKASRESEAARRRDHAELIVAIQSLADRTPRSARPLRGAPEDT